MIYDKRREKRDTRRKDKIREQRKREDRIG